MVGLPSRPRVQPGQSQAQSAYSPRDNEEWLKAYETVQENEDDLSLWEALVAATERALPDTSRGQSVNLATKEVLRNVFDRFLSRFPLLFGYWIKYAGIEYTFSGNDGAIRVYEHAVAAFPASVDLWTQYTTFMAGIGNIDATRAVCERGAEHCGRDFLSHPFWDAYIAFEDSIDKDGRRVAEIHRTIAYYPLHQYARYYERCIRLRERHPDVFADMDLTAVFQKTQQGTNDRWAYESQIQRSYFHVMELEPAQITNWNAYLDYEENQGDFEQICALYERALVPAAYYDTFWLRYAHWMSQQSEKQEDTRNIFRRACTAMVPIARPFIRFQWSIYEELCGNVTLARDILQAMINDNQHQESVEAAIRRVHLERRISPQQAVEFVDMELSKPGQTKENLVKAVFAASKAVIMWKDLANVEQARKMFDNNKSLYLNSRFFFVNYFEFEISNAKSTSEVHALWKFIVSRSKLPPTLIEDISGFYMTWLQQRGDLEKYIEVDIEMNGPFSVRSLHQRKLGEDTLSRLRKEAWHPGIEIDKYDRKNPFTKYLQQQQYAEI